MIGALLPRFVAVIVAAPVACVLTLWAATRLSFDAATAAALATALVFAAVLTAPSSKNAVVRALVAVLLAAALAGLAALYAPSATSSRALPAMSTQV